MATPIEIESLVVRLTGDGSSFQKMMVLAQASANQTAAIVKGAGAKVEAIAKNLKTFAADTMAALAAFGAGAWLKSLLHDFIELEEVVSRLTASMKANGVTVEAMMAQYREFAEVLKKTTTVGIDTTMALLAQAEQMGVSGAAAENAVKLAVALANGNERLAQTYMRATLQAQLGHPEMLRRMALGRGVRNEQEAMERIGKRLNAGWEAATERTKTLGGQLSILKDDIKEVNKQFGSIVAEGARPLVEWIDKTVKQFMDLSDETKRIVITGAAVLAFAVALRPALAAIGMLVGPAFNPLTFLLVGASFALNKWITQVGGIGPALEIVKAKATEVWDWITTQFNAAVEFMKPGWETIKRVAGEAWDWTKRKAGDFFEWIKPAWDVVVAAAKIAWNVIVFAVENAGTAMQAAADAVVASWNTAIDVVQKMAVALRDIASIGWGWISDFVNANAELVAGIGATIIAVYAAVAAVRILSAVFVALKIQQIASTIAWVAWKAVVIAATIVTTGWSIAMAIANGIIATATLVTAAFSATVVFLKATLAAIAIVGPLYAAWHALYTAGTLISTAATWLLNAALTVLDILLAPATIIAATIAIVAIGAAITIAWAAAAGLAGAIATLITSFATLASGAAVGGVLEHIGDLFGEWWAILKDVVAVAQSDLPDAFDRAWKLLRAGFSLAINQLHDIWVPLWEFIKTGFYALWEAVTATFAYKFRTVLVGVVKAMIDLAGMVAPGVKLFSGPIEDLLDEWVRTAELDAKRAKDAVKKIADTPLEIKESPETKAARDELNKVREGIKNDMEADLDDFLDAVQARANFEWFGKWTDQMKKAKEEQKKMPPPEMTANIDKATHAINKFDAALFGSAEAISRIQAQVNISSDKLGSTLAGVAGVGGVAGAGAAAAGAAQGAPDVLDMIKKQDEQIKKLEDKAKGLGLGAVAPGGVGLGGQGLGQQVPLKVAMEDSPDQRKSNDLLTQCRDVLLAINGKKGMVMEPADIAGIA